VRIQDYIADGAKDAAASAFKYAKAVPADKLDWAPDGARSVLSLCRELAHTPTWCMSAFNSDPSAWGQATMEGYKQKELAWTTVEHCEAEFNRAFTEVDAFFRGLSDEDLKKTKWLPFGGGRDHTYLEMMDYPRWNCTYHLGQIAYIQTLYGDKQMY
jgi:hypothetical protein